MMTPNQVQALNNAKRKIETFRDTLLREQRALDLPASSSTPGFFARYICCCFTPKKAIAATIEDGHEVSNAYASIIQILKHLNNSSIKTAIETNGTPRETIPKRLSTLSTNIENAIGNTINVINAVPNNEEQRLLDAQLNKLTALIDEHLPGIESDLSNAGITQMNDKFSYQTPGVRGSVN